MRLARISLIKTALLALILFFPFAVYADDTPPRLVFSDANISFVIPDGWDIESSFPMGPLFRKKNRDGSQAFITCEISKPLDANHMASNLPYQALREFAHSDIRSRAIQSRLLSDTDRKVADHNAVEVTWQNTVDTGTPEFQTDYFFSENRLYAISLRASADNFPWLVPAFQNWLDGIRILSARDSGALDQPAHGGLWVHQTGGIRIWIPENWLIGISDSRSLGIVLAGEKDQQAALTATVEPAIVEIPISPSDKAEAKTDIEKKGYKLISETDETFHGKPTFHLTYEGKRGSRLVRGEDLWIATEKGRWLFNLEADAVLFGKLAEDRQQILDDIEFF